MHHGFINTLGDPLQLPHPYAWNNYIWHLKEAGKIEKAVLLLRDFSWIEAKRFACQHQ
jgi:hypothetical protein